MLTFEERVLCGNTLQQFGSRFETMLEPTREFVHVANTRCHQRNEGKSGLEAE